MAKRRKAVTIVVLGVLAAVLMLAWYDGGREEQRMIVQPAQLPVDNTESGA